MGEFVSREDLVLPLDLHELPRSQQEKLLRRVWAQENDRAVRHAMGRYLESLCPWQVFATLTFAPKVKPRLVVSAQHAPYIVRESEREPQTNEQFAQRVVTRFVQILNEKCWGRRYYRRSDRVQMFVPWERQKWDALHCHPLIGNLPEGGELTADDELGVVRTERWGFPDIHEAWREAQVQFGLAPGYAWLKPFELGRVVDYVAKYVTKDLRGDSWALFGFGCKGSNRS